MKFSRRLVISGGVIAVLLLGYSVYTRRFAPTSETTSIPPTIIVESSPMATTTLAVVVTGLDTPWTITFLPDGEMMATERKGTIRVFGTKPRSIQVPGVIESGESGLTGLTLHPQFATNAYLYAYFTTNVDGKKVNRVVRYRFDGETIDQPVIVVDDIPAGTNHNGGQIAFGPDGKLYICTGDAETSTNAQNKNSLGGKILRVNDDGSIPQDNPFGTAVYSYGHRNPQGIVWDDQGRLWATEHGRSGVSTGYDEINLIEKGQNYGWPTIQGPVTREEMRAPVAQSGSKTTWAPAGIAFKNDTLYFTGLRGQSIYAMPISASGTPGTIQAFFREKYGRLRAMTVGPDGALYFSTSNHDGRGTPKAGDDQIIRWMP
jgi:glucose/arabinose dehydrogenase